MSANIDVSKNVFSQKKLGTRHVQVFLLFLGISLTWAGRFGIAVAIVAMTDANSTDVDYPTYDWDSEEKAIVLSSFFWSYVVMQIPSGFIADVYNAHKYVCCGVFVSSLLNMLTPLSVYYFGRTGAVVCRVLMGFTQSGLIPCSNTIFARWVPSEERSMLVPLVTAALPLGNIITLTTSGWLASSSLGWPSIFYVFGAVCILWSILFYCVAAASPSEHKTISLEERDYIEKSLNKSIVSKSKPVKIPWKSMFTSIPVWTLIITNCGSTWGLQMFTNKLPAYIKYGLGYDIGQSGTISALPYVATLVMAIFFGWICDLALKNGVSLCIVRKVINTVGMWGASVALLALCLVPTDSNLILLTILFVIFGLDSANYCGFSINHMDIAPNFAGIQVAIMNTAGLAVGQAGVLMCGYIVTDETNMDQWHIIFYITAGLYFIANLIFIIFGQAHVQPWNENKDNL